MKAKNLKHSEKWQQTWIKKKKKKIFIKSLDESENAPVCSEHFVEGTATII